MKVTSQEANKLLAKLNEDLNLLKSKENENCRFVAANSENKEDLRPDYNFMEMQNNQTILEGRIREIKHAINIFNSTTEVGDTGLTIDNVLVFLPQLTNKKCKLQNMISRKPFKRIATNGNIIDYEYLNYDLDEAKKEYDAVANLLSNLQNELTKTNVTVQFDIPD